MSRDWFYPWDQCLLWIPFQVNVIKHYYILYYTLTKYQVLLNVFIWPYLFWGEIQTPLCLVLSHTDLINLGLMCRPAKWTEQQKRGSTIWLETIPLQLSSLLQLASWHSCTVPPFLWCMLAISMYIASQIMALLLWVCFSLLSIL